MSSKSTFQYPPLQRSGQGAAIRLLTLLPGEFHEDVQCTLASVQLDDQPRYEALSYHWGPSDECSAVTCNGLSVQVTPNLLSALRHYRKEEEPRTLWIDAICINQRDDDEKSQQVPLMRVIYSSANTVLGWLGPGNKETPDVYMLLLDLARVQDEKAEKHDSRTYHELGPDGWEEYGLPQMFDPAYPALKQLLERPYFSRVWIVQELAVAQRALIRFGLDELPWDVFAKATLHAFMLLVPGHGDSARRFDRVQNIQTVRLATQARESTPLLNLLLSSRGLDATLPEDKVFAMCGLATDAGPDGLDVQTNYRAGMAAVYHDIASRMLNSHSTLDVLSVARAKDSYQLPSWVPDWRTPTSVLSLRVRGPDGEPFLRFSATPADNNSPAIQHKHGKIALSGFVMDHVAQIGLVHSNDTYTTKSTFAGLRQGWTSLAALGAWQEMICPSPDQPYPPTGESSREAYAQTIIAGSTHDGLEATMDQFESWDSISAELQAVAFRPMASMVTLRMFTRFWRYAKTVASVAGGDERMDKMIKFRRKMVFANYRRIFTTKEGYMGLGPEGMEIGDEIALVQRSMVPLVLRPLDGGAGGDRELVGDSYVHGIMHGEAYQPERCHEIWIA